MEKTVGGGGEKKIRSRAVWGGVRVGTHFCGLPTSIFYNPTRFFRFVFYLNGLPPVFIFYGLKAFYYLIGVYRSAAASLAFIRAARPIHRVYVYIVLLVTVRRTSLNGRDCRAVALALPPNSVPITVFLLLLLFSLYISFFAPAHYLILGSGFSPATARPRRPGG